MTHFVSWAPPRPTTNHHQPPTTNHQPSIQQILHDYPCGFAQICVFFFLRDLHFFKQHNLSGVPQLGATSLQRRSDQPLIVISLILFRAERGLTSRSSGLGSISIRSVLENFFTIQPSNHPTIQPSNKSYTITTAESTKFLSFSKLLIFF